MILKQRNCVNFCQLPLPIMLKLVAIACFLCGSISSSPVQQPSKEKIVGGTFADIDDYPWLLSLQRSKKHYCGGCLISPFYSLTAASCIEGEVLSTLRVRAGSTAHGSGGELRAIESAHIHEKYNPTTFDYDIAILRVVSHFEVGLVKIQRAFLPPAGYYPASGAVLDVAGWGIVGNLGTIIPGLLRAVSVPAVARESCKASYGSKVITDRMLCAGYETGGKDACKQDVGGPIVEGSTVVGIVTWRDVCGSAGYPGVYTDVAAVRDWISEITGV